MSSVKNLNIIHKKLCRSRSSIVVYCVLLMGSALNNVACDNNKKKQAPKASTDNSGGGSGSAGSGGTGGSTGGSSTGSGSSPGSGGTSGGSAGSDVSNKLTSDEKKALNRFACKNKDNPSKFAKFSKMVKDGDRKAIDSISADFDKEKVDALIKLAKAVGGSESKAKASLKSVCNENADEKE